jgi:hypothetical protein
VVAPYCQLTGSITNMVADAAAKGSRELALQTLLMDPFIHSATVAEALLDDMLAYSRQYETRFEWVGESWEGACGERPRYGGGKGGWKLSRGAAR